MKINTYLELEKIRENHKGEVCIFGAGRMGRYEGYELIKAAGFKVDFYCDNHVSAGTVIRDGIEVKDIKYLYSKAADVLVFLCMGPNDCKKVMTQIEEHNIERHVCADMQVIHSVLRSVEAADDETKKRYHALYDDNNYLKILFFIRTGKELNLQNPQTFNEKLQWLKIHNRKPEYTRMVDKFEFKNYVEEKLGSGYTIPTIGVYDSVDEIEWDKLPEQFVLKCTHDSGSIAICRDKKEFDIDIDTKFLRERLSVNYFWYSREWPYKNVKPRIIAEQYMQDGDNETLNVYKIFNFHGVPKLIQMIQNDKTPEETIDYFDTDWNLLELRQNYPNSEKPLPRPQKLEEMLSLARKLSEGIPFVRTDFYVINGKVYVSEFTFFSDGGMAVFHPEKWDKILGEWI